MGSQENLCKVRGCEMCCHNTFLGMRRDNFELFKAKLEERGVELDIQAYESFTKLQGLTTNSRGNTVVIYCEEHDQPADVLVQIFRTCVFLVDGDCVLINDPARPTGCGAFKLDGVDCKKISSGGFSFIPDVSIE